MCQSLIFNLFQSHFVFSVSAHATLVSAVPSKKGEIHSKECVKVLAFRCQNFPFQQFPLPTDHLKGADLVLHLKYLPEHHHIVATIVCCIMVAMMTWLPSLSSPSIKMPGSHEWAVSGPKVKNLPREELSNFPLGGFAVALHYICTT